MPLSADDSFARALAALQAGQLEDAERLFKKTLRLQPRHVPALNLIGVVLTQLKRYGEAEQYIKRAIQENANSDATFYNYGVILKALKRNEEALEQFNKAIAINGSVADTLNARGEVLLNLGEAEKALQDFDKALAINPRFLDALINKARALPEEEAKTALGIVEQALKLQPNRALAWLARANILHGLNRFDEALDSFARSLALQPDLVEAWLGRGDTFGDMRKLDEARESYEKALSIDDKNSAAQLALGSHFLEVGRIDDARQLFRKSIEHEPGGGAYWNLCSTKKFKAGDPDIAAMEALATQQGLLKRNRMFLDFALGKAYADIGEHRRSFEHLLAANAIERETVKYSEAEPAALYQNVQRVFTPALLAAKSGFGDPSRRPIFIVGMPRSGSTLLEQILSSHPAVEGVGEVTAYPEAANNVIGRALDSRITDARYPDIVADLDGKTLMSIGQDYLGRIAALATTDAERLTDKLLSKYLYIGLIHLTLPNAVILHTVRNPLDTCISCFSIRFKDRKLRFTYDLGELGRTYRRYQAVMRHWHSVLPGKVLDVQYEDVVADTEGQARRIIAHCGLPWDDRCLAFHKNDRAVRTASVSQVRQPIYKSSVSRWKPYEEFLGPLLKELEIDPQAAE
jgi:tetratricopeptide (TPR) repeat protein